MPLNFLPLKVSRVDHIFTFFFQFQIYQEVAIYHIVPYLCNLLYHNNWKSIWHFNLAHSTLCSKDRLKLYVSHIFYFLLLLFKFSIVYTGLLVLWLVSSSRTGFSLCTCSWAVGKKDPFSMAIGNVELIHKCFPKHPSMETARLK